MLNEISSRQFVEWQAFWQVEPFGPQRDDWRMACLLAVVVNALRGKDEEPVTPQTLLAWLDPSGETEAPLPAAEQASQAFEEQWRAMMGDSLG